MHTVTARTEARRAAKARAALLAPYEAMSDRDLFRAYHLADRLDTNPQAAYTVISDRVNARRIPIDYTGHTDGAKALVAAFRAHAEATA